MTEPESVWMRIRAKFGDPAITTREGRQRARAREAASQPFGQGRDPRLLDAVLEKFSVEMGWSERLDQAALASAWPTIVGEASASRTRLLGVEDGTLHVECETAAWAIGMRPLQGEILTRLVTEFPHSGITAVRFRGPGSTRSFHA